LLDKSLIVIQGDHGPRIGEDGVYVDYGWWEHIYRAPLLIRAPGLLPKRIEQDPLRPFIALDIAPTILDALGVSPNILKNFVGQSIFRARGTRQVRDSYHAQSRGGQYPHVLRLEKNNGYKGVRWDNGDTCATDIQIDPSETYFYCVNEGWRKVFEDEVMTDGLIKGLWIEGSSDEKKLIDYAHEAKKQLDIHLEINADFWDTSKHKEEYAEEKIKFLQTVKEQAHWI
jgi:arylsulfatase A-like enzyme